MEITLIITFFLIFTMVCFYCIKEEPEFHKGAHCIYDECNHSFIETEYYGGKCGGSQFYECTKCKASAVNRWSI